MATKAAKPAARPKVANGDAPELPRPPPWYATLRAEPPAWLGKVLGLACVLLVLAIWWWFTHGDNPVERRISPAKLPSPDEVWAHLVQTLKERAPRLPARRNLPGGVA